VIGYIKDHPVIPVREISQILGIPWATISRYLRKAGLVSQHEDRKHSIKKLNKYEEAIEFNEKVRKEKKKNPGWR